MKTYNIEIVRVGMGNSSVHDTGHKTLAELVEYFSYTLKCGASYQHEKGNKKINCNPKSIKSLITNLNNAVNNSAANGCSSTYYREVC